MPPTLLLFTDAYPYAGGESAFLPPEIDALARAWNVVVVPGSRPPGNLDSTPSGVRVDTDLANAGGGTSRWLRLLGRGSLSRAVWREVVRQAPRSLHPRALATVIRRQARATRVEAWVRRQMDAGRWERVDLAYSWWSSTTALGVGRALRASGIPTVSRAHGFDLFAEQEAVGFVPFQRELLELNAAVFSVSDAGASRLRQSFPWLANKVITARLGVPGASRVNRGSQDGCFRVVSCSSVVPVKRVWLLADAICAIRRAEPGLKILWTHLGGGPGLPDLERLVHSSPDLAGRVSLLGQIPHVDVLEWLGSNPIDAFVNVSSSEGIPVSLMEAASFGIPMIATDVGGSAEIVGADSGVLLPPDAGDVEVSLAIRDLASRSLWERDRLRIGALRTWEERFSADRNYADFSNQLEAIAREP